MQTQVEQMALFEHHNNLCHDAKQTGAELIELTVEADIVQSRFSSVDEIIAQRVTSGAAMEKSFYIADFQDIYAKHAKWSQLLPRVKPFYAVKCNNLPEIVSLLAMIGTNFDCASKAEIDQVLALGVDPSRIIYANPCKTRSFIKHANNVNVNVMTFDNELELHKIAAVHPNAELVLRIKGDDSSSRCKFNIKFGADLAKCSDLLILARELNLKVVGVSFHNGSDCEDINAFARSIENAKLIFELGKTIGHEMRIVDIGGGFPGHESASGVSFEQLSSVVNASLDAHFPEVDRDTGMPTCYEIIAEPGRYYVASALTLASMVVAKRIELNDKTNAECYMYYLNDGVYGAFNNIIFEHATPEPELLSLSNSNSTNNTADGNGRCCKSLLSSFNANIECCDGERKSRQTVLWGPTCDSVDCIKRNFMFPELQIGEWIVFKNMGAYTCCAATNFNGFEKAAVIVAF